MDFQNAPWWFWSLLSALFAGVTAVLAKVGVEGVPVSLATALRTGVVLLFTAALATRGATVSVFWEMPRRAWIFLVLSGLATGLSWLCYFRALQTGKASQVAPVDKLSVVFAVILAVLFLGETPGWPQWVGIALIVAGALVMAL